MNLVLLQEENLCETIRKYPVIFNKSCNRYKESDAVANAWEEIANSLEFIRDGMHYSIFYKLSFVLDGNSHYSLKSLLTVIYHTVTSTFLRSNYIISASLNVLFFNKEGKKNWAQVNGLKNVSRKCILKKRAMRLRDFDVIQYMNLLWRKDIWKGGMLWKN